MANEVRTPPLPAGAVAAGVPAKTSVIDYVDQALEGLWHLLTSMRVAMVLMIVLAGLCVFGSLVMQLPTGMDDAASKSAWLASIRPRYGGWATVMTWLPGAPTVVVGIGLIVAPFFRSARRATFDWLMVLGGALIIVIGVLALATDTLGLLDVFHSLLFRVLVVGLVISLIACSVHRVPGAWRTATKPRVDVGPGFFEHAPQHEQIVVHATSAEALDKVRGVMRKRHYRTITQDDGTIHIYGDRFRFVAFASLAGHISLILILLGAIVGTAFGFKNQYFVVPEGSTVLTGTEDGLALKLNSFSDTYYPTTGAPSDYVSQVVLLKDGQQVAASTIRVNTPLSYNGATYYQRGFGPAVVLTVKDASGNTVYNEGMPLDGSGTLSDNVSRTAGSLTLPGSGDLINVYQTEGTSDSIIQPGQVEVVLYSGGATTPTDTKVMDQGKATQVGTYSVTFNREAKYTVLSINRDPGQILVWLGALILFGGFTLVFLLPQRRVWARISQRGAMAVLSVASLGRRDAALGTDFDDLVTDIRTALQTPAQA